MLWCGVVCLVRPCLDDDLGFFFSDSLCLIGLLFDEVIRVTILNVPTLHV